MKIADSGVLFEENIEDANILAFPSLCRNGNGEIIATFQSSRKKIMPM